MVSKNSTTEDKATGEAAADSEQASAGKAGSGSPRNKRIAAGAAIGIGSAALVAALLYANRSRKQDKS
jgi:hypothetical protein